MAQQIAKECDSNGSEDSNDFFLIRLVRIGLLLFSIVIIQTLIFLKIKSCSSFSVDHINNRTNRYGINLLIIK